jgi:hypothetical protein
VALSSGFYATILGTRAPRVDPTRLGVHFDARGPFTAFWHALKVGREPEDALASGRFALESSTGRFVVSNARRTGDHVAAKSGQPAPRWQRVPSADACPWCRKVALQTYLSAETADFGHDGCACAAVPVEAVRT